MSSSGTLCNRSQFAYSDARADPSTAAAIRREFSEWLHSHFVLDASKACDVVLAVNEAMANAAEYAYATADEPGVMQVQAQYDENAATLTVTVADRGAWRDRDPGARELKRGRGIPLMQALADQATVDTSPTGTRVCLEWTGVDAAR
ncbi:ATP-binding protein [Mycobacterium sp. NPDC048908]|uniref:ATP-binding protein n=1 Tax=Mycobacterium sp. NPDC048908 TaxID=3364292 RepID=UPI003715EE3C